MATIDVTAAYVRMDEILREYGYEGENYSVNLEVWNHGRGFPRITMHVSVVPVDGPVLIGYGSSFDAAFEDLRAKIVNHQTEGHGAGDLARVRVPETAPVESAA
jgi:hypothetical protein